MAVGQAFQDYLPARGVEKPRNRLSLGDSADASRSHTGLRSSPGERDKPILWNRAQNLVIVSAGDYGFDADSSAREQVGRRSG